jgi:hypothetical protein
MLQDWEFFRGIDPNVLTELGETSTRRLFLSYSRVASTRSSLLEETHPHACVVTLKRDQQVLPRFQRARLREKKPGGN